MRPPEHHHRPEIWLSWRLRMASDETFALPKQNCPWRKLNRHAGLTGLGEQDKVHRSLMLGSWKFQSRCKIVENPWYWRFRCNLPLFTWVIHEKPRAGIDPLRVRVACWHNMLMCCFGTVTEPGPIYIYVDLSFWLLTGEIQEQNITHSLLGLLRKMVWEILCHGSSQWPCRGTNCDPGISPVFGQNTVLRLKGRPSKVRCKYRI